MCSRLKARNLFLVSKDNIRQGVNISNRYSQDSYNENSSYCLLKIKKHILCVKYSCNKSITIWTEKSIYDNEYTLLLLFSQRVCAVILILITSM